MFVMVVIVLAACSNSNRFKDTWESGNYEEALKVYKENEFTQEELRVMKNVVDDNFGKIIEEYASGEIKKKAVDEVLDKASEIAIDGMPEVIVKVKKELAKLERSKKFFKQAKKDFENEDYSEAYDNLLGIIKEDVENYDEAQKMMPQCIENYSSTFEKDKDYEGLIAYLDEKSRNSFDKAAKEYIKSEKKEFIVEAVLSNTKDKVDQEGYAEAISYLKKRLEKNNVDNVDEIDKYMNEINEAYKKEILDIVKEYEGNKKYLKALDVLADARDVVDLQDFSKAEDRINEERPIYLCDLGKTIDNENYHRADKGDDLKDTEGNIYEQDKNLYYFEYEYLEFLNPKTGKIRKAKAFAEYNLGGKYKSLSGKVVVWDKTDTYIHKPKAYKNAFTVVISGDGKEIKRLRYDVNETIDVSGIKTLRIEVDYGNNNLPNTIYVLLSDFKLTK